jgi:hypothetical protein
MATAALAGFSGLYADEVFTSKDLHRRAGEVLNHARTAPVTISRNNEQFALLKRELVGELVQAFRYYSTSIELMMAAGLVSDGKPVPETFLWLKAFDKSELLEMCKEMLTVVSRVKENSDWKRVDDVIHEWHESALAVQSGTLKEAISAAADQSPLPDPFSVVPEALSSASSK